MTTVAQLGRFLIDNRLEIRVQVTPDKFRVLLIDGAGDVHVGLANKLPDAVSGALHVWALSSPRAREAQA